MTPQNEPEETDEPEQAVVLPADWYDDPTRVMREQYGDIFRLDTFPWVVADDASSPYVLQNVLQKWDDFDGPHGHVTRDWRVTASMQYGLPRASDRKLHKALILMTANRGWQNEKIDFRFRSLALDLKMRPGPKAFAWINAALDRLYAVSVCFQGKIEEPNDRRTALMGCFGIIGGIYRDAHDKDVYCEIPWDPEVFRALASAAREHAETQSTLPLQEALLGNMMPSHPDHTRLG